MSKIITTKTEVFSFSELTEEAKEKAREKFNESADYPFLTDDLREYIHEELTEKGFTYSEITPFYSLSYSQGDGLMFESSITDKKGNTYTIKQSGHYNHERSTTISGEDKNGEEIETKYFEEEIYIPICERVRDKGYSIIEYQDSEESFAETCEANEYQFTADGKMFN